MTGKSLGTKFLSANAFIIATAIIGLTIDCMAYFPGMLSPDSVDQYRQALSHQYSDWHPPIMAAFWSVLIHIYPGGASMFLLQVFCFWMAYFILCRIALQHFRKVVFIIPFLFFAPFTQNFVGNIWKDIGLSISWLLAVAVMLRSFYNSRPLTKWEAALTLMLLCYGCWIRINALPGVIPLLSLWFITLFRNNGLSSKKLISYTLLLGSLLLAVQLGITRLILKPLKTYPEYKLFVHDLSGIYKKTGQVYFPSFILRHPDFDTAYIRRKYKYSTFDNIWWNSDSVRVLPDPSPAQMDSLQWAWIKGITHNPLVYLSNRGAGFLNFLRLYPSGSRLTITYADTHPNNLGLSFKRRRITINMRSGIEFQRSMPWMQPWFWVLLNIIVLVLAYRPVYIEIKPVILCLAYSSLFYLLLEFIVFQADTELRYFYWNILAVSLSLLLLLGQRLKLKYNEKVGAKTNN